MPYRQSDTNRRDGLKQALSLSRWRNSSQREANLAQFLGEYQRRKVDMSPRERLTALNRLFRHEQRHASKKFSPFYDGEEQELLTPIGTIMTPLLLTASCLREICTREENPLKRRIAGLAVLSVGIGLFYAGQSIYQHVGLTNPAILSYMSLSLTWHGLIKSSVHKKIQEDIKKHTFGDIHYKDLVEERDLLQEHVRAEDQASRRAFLRNFSLWRIAATVRAIAFKPNQEASPQSDISLFEDPAPAPNLTPTLTSTPLPTHATRSASTETQFPAVSKTPQSREIAVTDAPKYPQHSLQPAPHSRNEMRDSSTGTAAAPELEAAALMEAGSEEGAIVQKRAFIDSRNR